MSSPQPEPRPSSFARKAASYPALGAATARNFLRQRAYPVLCEGLARVGHPLLLARAKDMTSQTATRSCLVLAPHPDDETLGCGATIMRKLAAGTHVAVVIASDGRHSHHSDKFSADALVELREKEALRAGSVLGLLPENIVFLRFEDRRLADNRQQLRERLFPIIDKADPEEIFVSSIIDTHPDHQVLGELARELVRSRPQRSPILYEYPIWFWDPRRWRLSELAGLSIHFVRSGEFSGRKGEAIACYRSQLTNLTGETDWPPTLRPGFVRQFLYPEEIFFEIAAP